MSTAMSSTPHHTTQPATFKQQRAQQRGMTLVELMVGITVGLLVTLAAIGTVYMTKVSSVTLVDSARLEQETNMVMNVIAEQIKQAGARNLEPSLTPAGGNADELLLPVRYQDFAGLNGASATQRKIVVQGKTNAPNFDQITFTYSQPPAGTAANTFQGMAQNCAGEGAIQYPLPTGSTPVAQSMQVVSTLRTSTSAGATNLICVTPDAIAASQPIASNIAEFKVRYLRNNGSVSRILTANEVEASSEGWAGIDGIEVCLHITGEATKAASTAPSTSIKSCAGNPIPNDGKLHRVARNVFQLRNSASL